MTRDEFTRLWAVMESRGDKPLELLADMVAAERVGLPVPAVDDCAATGYQPTCPNHGDRRAT